MSISRLRITSRIGVSWTSTSYIDFSSESGSMPCDIVRLPCGSMSTHSTRCPRSANATARFSVVVVLATPPFWLAKAMTLAWFCCALSTWVLRFVAGKPVRRVDSLQCGCPSRPDSVADGCEALTHWDDVAASTIARGDLDGRRRRWRRSGARALGLSRYEPGPGERSMPVHVHGDEEEIFVVLGGSG